MMRRVPLLRLMSMFSVILVKILEIKKYLFAMGKRH